MVLPLPVGCGTDGHTHDEEGAHAHTHADPTAAYADLTNPLTSGDSAALEAGRQSYATACASYHGEAGAGDGVGGAGLTPAAAALRDSEFLSGASDAYLFWRISEEGGVDPFSSKMPAYSDKLTEEQRWQVVLFVRRLPEHRLMQSRRRQVLALCISVR